MLSRVPVPPATVVTVVIVSLVWHVSTMHVVRVIIVMHVSVKWKIIIASPRIV